MTFRTVPRRNHLQRSWQRHKDQYPNATNVRRHSFDAGYEAGREYQRFVDNAEGVIQALADPRERERMWADNTELMLRLREFLQ